MPLSSPSPCRACTPTPQDRGQVQGVGGAEKKLAQGSALQPAGRLREGAEGLGRPRPAGVLDLRLGLSRTVRPGPPLFHLVSGGRAESTVQGPGHPGATEPLSWRFRENGWGGVWGQGHLQDGGAGVGLERVACGWLGTDKAKGTDMVDAGSIRGDTDSEVAPLSEAGKEWAGGAGWREIMNSALEPAGAGAINPREEGGRLLCWLSTCTAACSECPSNRLRDLCKAGCAGALIGL